MPPQPSPMAVHRKRIGAWYTPEPFARMLVDWALAGRPGRVLDPSFGGCSFLRAAVGGLRALGVVEPGRMVTGVDIDDDTVRNAPRALADCTIPERNIVRGDFLGIQPSLLGPFAAVVGNPPYIRHHLMTAEAQVIAQRAAEVAGVGLPRRAGSWAYFLFHAARFVGEGGRMAFLLPGAVLSAHYATPVLEHMKTCFGGLELVRLRERLFPDALEETVLLLGTDAGASTDSISYSEIADRDALRSHLHSGTGGTLLHHAAYKLDLLDTTAADLFNAITGDAHVVPLGTMATVRIGVVTGANDFFIRPKSAWEAVEAPAVPIVARRAWLVGATWEERDKRRLDRNDNRARLLALHEWPESRRLQRLLATGKKTYGHRHHCSHRDPWYAVDLGESPHAFLGYMGANPPRLVLNRMNTTCTNAIHRIDFNIDEQSRRSAVLGSWTTAFRLGCELVGRHYGGGILKLEPAEAKQVPVPTVGVAADSLDRIDALARQGDMIAATAMADRLVLIEGLGLREADLLKLRQAADLLAARRQPPRRTR